MLISSFSIALVSFLFSVFFIVVLKKFSKVRGVLLDKQIPSVGGLALGLSFFLVCFLYWFPASTMPSYVAGFLIASGVVLVFGFVDDILGLPVISKFFVQILATAILVSFGLKTHIVYIGTIGNILVTLLWVVGLTNAFNLLDVMDGLAASVAIIASVIFAFSALLTGNIPILVLSLALAGAAFGFILFNFPPAKVYLGNAGSHFLGFLFSVIAIAISYATAKNKIALLAPILILGFPILDTVFLVFMRIRCGKSAFNKSNDHLALRFLKSGYSKQKALAVMFVVALLFGLCGLSLLGTPGLLSVLLAVFALVFSLILFRKMSVVEV